MQPVIKHYWIIITDASVCKLNFNVVAGEGGAILTTTHTLGGGGDCTIMQIHFDLEILKKYK